jgi:hypothetical protein
MCLCGPELNQRHAFGGITGPLLSASRNGRMQCPESRVVLSGYLEYLLPFSAFFYFNMMEDRTRNHLGARQICVQLFS